MDDDGEEYWVEEGGGELWASVCAGVEGEEDHFGGAAYGVAVGA